MFTPSNENEVELFLVLLVSLSLLGHFILLDNQKTEIVSVDYVTNIF